MQQRTRPRGTRGAGSPSARGQRAGDRGRGPARPAVGRRAVASGGAAKRTRAPQPRRFTSRAAVLGLVLLILLLAYAYPVREYLAQQAEISALEQSQEAQREKIERMKAQAAKWDDNEYVISQARQRLQMVLPGEKHYMVIDPERGKDAGQGAQAGKDKRSRAWYGKLWSSVEAADRR